MGISERKGRERAERELRIVAAARAIAEGEGWAAVTVRRLAEEIEHSQPVLYSHFENRDAIVAAVAVEGFRELTAALLRAAGEACDGVGDDAGDGAGDGAGGRRAALEAVGFAYLTFARANPALYEAMFTLPTRLHFAVSDTEPELRATFGALAAVVEPAGVEPAGVGGCAAAGADDGTATETFWAALHGLAALERSGRIRVGARAGRMRVVVRGMLDP